METRTQGPRKRSRHCPICKPSCRPPYRHLRIRSFRNCSLYGSWPPVHRKLITSRIYFRIAHLPQSFAPTVLFTIAIPRYLALYRGRAQRLTQWENHKHQSAFDASFTTKTFALSSIVAYLGLALSAFVYVPFGETAIHQVQRFLSLNSSAAFSVTTPSTLTGEAAKADHTFFVSDQNAARAKLDRSRLEDQMFAYTVTNQATDFFTEIGLPFLTRAFTLVRSGKYRSSLFGMGMGAPKKKRVGFEDDKNGAARDEREFLERVRREVSLPQYELFGDYNEMVTQFGYVALWSTIWPLAPGPSPSQPLFIICTHNTDFPHKKLASDGVT